MDEKKRNEKQGEDCPACVEEALEDVGCGECEHCARAHRIMMNVTYVLERLNKERAN